MNLPSIYTGDIIITNNRKLVARIVQFLSTAPTIWHHLYWYLFDRQHLNNLRPAGYHYAMALNEKLLIEQQDKVEIKLIQTAFKKDVYIYRKKNLSTDQRHILARASQLDLGEGFGVKECIGKLLTWLTGIKAFILWSDISNQAICVVRIGEWYERVGETFGVGNPNFLTARLRERYLIPSPDWVEVYKKESK